MNDIIRKIEARGWDWLVRSNHYKSDDVQASYFANITQGTSIRPGFQSYPTYGHTAEEALENAYQLWKTHVKS